MRVSWCSCRRFCGLCARASCRQSGCCCTRVRRRLLRLRWRRSRSRLRSCASHRVQATPCPLPLLLASRSPRGQGAVRAGGRVAGLVAPRPPYWPVAPSPPRRQARRRLHQSARAQGAEAQAPASPHLNATTIAHCAKGHQKIPQETRTRAMIYTNTKNAPVQNSKNPPAMVNSARCGVPFPTRRTRSDVPILLAQRMEEILDF